MSEETYYLPSGIEDISIERVIAEAKRRAVDLQNSSGVYRGSDGVLIATVWPDGRVDLTFAGSSVA